MSAVARATRDRLGVRLASAADADRLGAICHDAFAAIAGRHGFPKDFPDAATARALAVQLIARPDVFAVIAERDGQVLGGNYLWECDEVGGVGPITVDPDAQDAGLGRTLMQAVLERARAQDRRAVRLVQAGYHMRSLALYTGLGFVVREPLVLVQGTPPGSTLPGRHVRLAGSADQAPAEDLCRRVHGISRGNELGDAIRAGRARVVERDGRLVGYDTGIGFFGHAVAENDGDLLALIAAAPSYGGLGFLLPNRQSTVLRGCLDFGLRLIQPMTLMSLGPYAEARGAFLPSILY